MQFSEFISEFGNLTLHCTILHLTFAFEFSGMTSTTLNLFMHKRVMTPLFYFLGAETQ